MTDGVIHLRYRELACASIQQGINDWLGDKYATDYDLYKWLQDCEWFDYLQIDRDYVFVKIIKLKRQGKKKVRFRDYGK